MAIQSMSANERVNSVLSEGSYEPGARAVRALIIFGSSKPLVLFSWVRK